MNKNLIMNYINEGKLNALELIDILHNKESYNFTEEEIFEIEEELKYKIESSDNKVELIKIKEKQLRYKMDTSMTDKYIKRCEPVKDEDINNFDFQEVEYYIYDGFDNLNSHQQYLLLDKARKLKFDSEEINYLIEKINEYKEYKTEKSNDHIKDKIKLGDIITANYIYSSFKEHSNEKNKNDYEPYQFEEEELEDDDYYYEDPD